MGGNPTSSSTPPHPSEPTPSLLSSAPGPGAALPGRHGTGELGFGPGAQLGQPVHAALPRGSLCGGQPGTRLLCGQLLRATHSHVVHTLLPTLLPVPCWPHSRAEAAGPRQGSAAPPAAPSPDPPSAPAVLQPPLPIPGNEAVPEGAPAPLRPPVAWTHHCGDLGSRLLLRSRRSRLPLFCLALGDRERGQGRTERPARGGCR